MSIAFLTGFHCSYYIEICHFEYYGSNGAENSFSVAGQYCLFPGIEAQLAAILVDGEVVDSISASSSPSTIVVVFNGTNFYAEAGGQKADEGTISCGDNKLKVVDVQEEDGYVLHYAELLQGQFKVCPFEVSHRQKSPSE